ncbi:hypothetical protein LTR36_001883 [Oleoguttula mirabilis]|uniref:Xylanolytic transcriptional activator regulatory domain-containing protein n=1 Tax=Oleoguttula mirabilis TaxID=1507867 RepID=A0AAV9JMA5_9PEZI|nr:hypothetical protein LTR36_001883 [Oleoguttula mirabilis]
MPQPLTLHSLRMLAGIANINRQLTDNGRKDKTMVHILDALTRLENKFDNMSITRGSSASDVDSPAFGTTASGLSSAASFTESASKDTGKDKTHEFLAGPRQPYQHLTVPHKIMLWPSIYIHLISSDISAASDLQFILQEGTPWVIKRELSKHPEPLRSDVGLPCFSVSAPGGGGNTRSSNVAFPTLTPQQIQEYTDAYFNTFNVLYPLLNRESFMNDVVARLLREGYGDGDVGSVLALLVFSLGQVAIEGVFERPISIVSGQPSGFRGGSIDSPPGLGLFNEARRRLGFVATQCSLQNVQIMLLQATYYESTARHLDFWRSTVAASMACQVLIRCQNIDWASTEGDLIKRAYWTCILTEDLYHFDLDLPQTGIHTMEDEVPLPYFNDTQQEQQQGAGTSANGVATSTIERNNHRYHFLAMIALRRLIARIHGVVHECERATSHSEPLWQNSNETGQDVSDDYGGPPVAVIREMVRQLDSWRALLPRPLQWSDNDKFDFPAADHTNRRPNEALFSFDQGPVPIGHKYNLDVVTAQLRTRFYYARFMMYRPFVYKALHFPELMTEDDRNCCALAIKSACMWPLAMSPPKNKKRLVPHLFAWTQNFMGILLIMSMCTANECLRRIIDEGGVVGWEEIDRTIHLMLEWVRDAKQVDGIAEWSWSILEPLYADRLSRSAK